MPVQDDFSQLLAQLRGGDADAAWALVQRYESAVRVAIRTRLSDPRLRRQFDSMDVCQSVLASFFLHVAAGAYELDEPRQLVALLTKMAHNKLAMRARSEHRERRDVRRLSPAPVELANPSSSAPSPLRHVAGKELLDRALEMMTPEVRAIALKRIGGETWPEIASELGGTPEGRRKQYERGVEVVAQTLEVDLSDG